MTLFSRGDDFLADPMRMMHVQYDLNGVPCDVVALYCGYVSVVQGVDKRAIAIEVIFDPAIQLPHELPQTPYYCPSSRLDRHLIPPKALKKISSVVAQTGQALMPRFDKE